MQRKLTKRHFFTPTRRRAHHGSAIVLCLLAVAVSSVATLTIVRSQRRATARASALLDRTAGDAIAQGLLHRQIALVKRDGGLKKIDIDPVVEKLGYTKSRVVFQDDPVNRVLSFQVYLHPDAPLNLPAASGSVKY